MTRNPTDSDCRMDSTERLFLEALRCGVAGQPVPWTAEPDGATQIALVRLARAQALQPVIAHAISGCPAMGDSRAFSALKQEARAVTVHQATRTAEFLLLLRELEARGLRPAVFKGAVCRRLYPEPEQRPSSDEDILIASEEFPAYHKALLDCGLQLLRTEEPLTDPDEVTYVDPDRDLYLELHMRLFPSGSAAYGDCNRFLEGALSRRVRVSVYGQTLETLHPTDHLLFLLCHAYKHILHGGVGIRQICDLCLFARRYEAEIDWSRVRRAAEELRIETLSAAFFRIGERHLGIPGPKAFADLKPDEEPLLHDCLTGGLYGADDPDRLHSSNLTLEAIAAEKQGRRQLGLAKALFPSAATLSGRFPYLYKRPWLLPVAWTQRIVRYLSEKRAPSKTLQIGQERIKLLRRYRLLD